MNRQVGNGIMPLFNQVPGLHVHQVSGSGGLYRQMDRP
jgi:hypothetical protein